MDNEASNLTKFSQEERGSTFSVNIGTISLYYTV
jgi:hypothetical protein